MSSSDRPRRKACAPGISRPWSFCTSLSVTTASFFTFPPDAQRFVWFEFHNMNAYFMSTQNILSRIEKFTILNDNN
jgi:hypothetical protein